MEINYFKLAPTLFGPLMIRALNDGDSRAVFNAFQVYQVPSHDYKTALNHLILGCSFASDLNSHGVNKVREAIENPPTRTATMRTLAKSIVREARGAGFCDGELVQLATNILGVVTEDIRGRP